MVKRYEHTNTQYSAIASLEGLDLNIERVCASTAHDDAVKQVEHQRDVRLQ
jgi:hypothetical protein